MADTTQAFADDIGVDEIEAKKAEIARLQAEIDEEATPAVEILDVDDDGKAAEDEKDNLGSAVIESWDNREIRFKRPPTTAMLLFAYRMESGTKDEDNQLFHLLGFLERWLVLADWNAMSAVWEDTGNLGLLIEMSQEIAGAMGEQALEPDEDQMNRAMRRVEERAKKAKAKAALEAKGGHNGKGGEPRK